MPLIDLITQLHSTHFNATQLALPCTDLVLGVAGSFLELVQSYGVAMQANRLQRHTLGHNTRWHLVDVVLIEQQALQFEQMGELVGDGGDVVVGCIDLFQFCATAQGCWQCRDAVVCNVEHLELNHYGHKHQQSTNQANKQVSK